MEIATSRKLKTASAKKGKEEGVHDLSESDSECDDQFSATVMCFEILKTCLSKRGI